MMIDDDTLKQLLRINDDFLQLCKWLNEMRDTKISARLIPLVDDLTHILIEAGKSNKLIETNFKFNAFTTVGKPSVAPPRGLWWI